MTGVVGFIAGASIGTLCFQEGARFGHKHILEKQKFQNLKEYMFAGGLGTSELLSLGLTTLTLAFGSHPVVTAFKIGSIAANVLGSALLSKIDNQNFGKSLAAGVIAATGTYFLLDKTTTILKISNVLTDALSLDMALWYGSATAAYRKEMNDFLNAVYFPQV